KARSEPYRFLAISRPTHDGVEATSILPSLNVKTARLWRAIVPFTHLAREGRMTVTIGRRKLLVALGGAAAAPPRHGSRRTVSPARAPMAHRVSHSGLMAVAKLLKIILV